MKVAVLIPCYNEAKTISKVVSDFKNVLPEASIYVFDNNSTDMSDQLAREAGAIVEYTRLQGKGNVVRSMFREIDADYYIMVDGDDTYPAEQARELLECISLHSYDMAIGDRLSSTYYKENKRRFHNSGNYIVKSLVNLLFGGKITDIMTGYRAFSKTFVKSFPVISSGFEIETEMTIHALDKKFPVCAIPIDYRDRPKDSFSKLNTYKDGFKVLIMIFRLLKDYKPFSFFGGISLMLFLSSFILFIPVVLEYRITGLVPRFPTLVISGFIMIASIQSLSIGLTLETQKRLHRENFEMFLNILSGK